MSSVPSVSSTNTPSVSDPRVPPEVQEYLSLKALGRVQRNREAQLAPIAKQYLASISSHRWESGEGTLRLKTAEECGPITQKYLREILMQFVRTLPQYVGTTTGDEDAQLMATYVWTHRPKVQVERLEQIWPRQSSVRDVVMRD